MQTDVRVLVVGKTEHVQVRLCRLVDEMAFKVVGTAPSGEAARHIRNTKPHLVLLEVGAEGDGLDLIATLGESRAPLFVVVAPDTRGAVHAYELGVVDYLVKPLHDARLHAALERVRSRFFSAPAAGIPQSRSRRQPRSRREAPQSAPDSAVPGRRLALKQGKSTVLLELDGIDWIEADDVYLNFHVGERTYLIRERLKHVERCLKGKGFLRIHRSTIVNLARVRKVVSESGTGGHVVLADGVQLRVSKSNFKELEACVAFRQLG